MQSQLVKTVIKGLKAAQLVRGQWSEIALESGVSRSTIVKLAAGDNDSIKAPNLEQIYLALVRRGHLDRTFVFESVA